jgi:hypothetical protein
MGFGLEPSLEAAAFAERSPWHESLTHGRSAHEMGRKGYVFALPVDSSSLGSGAWISKGIFLVSSATTRTASNE